MNHHHHSRDKPCKYLARKNLENLKKKTTVYIRGFILQRKREHFLTVVVGDSCLCFSQSNQLRGSFHEQQGERKRDQQPGLPEERAATEAP
jgi:hypothetical protein